MPSNSSSTIARRRPGLSDAQELALYAAGSRQVVVDAAIRDVRRLTAAKLVAPLLAQGPDDRVLSAVPKLLIEGCSADAVNYHAWLLGEEGLIEGCDMTGDGDAVHCHWPTCLTYKGHDSLEHARNDTRWKATKDRLLSIGGAMTPQMLLMVSKELLRAELGY